MTEKNSNNTVARDVVAGRKQYVKPQCEVIYLDEEPKLLSASGGTYNARFGYEDEDI